MFEPVRFEDKGNYYEIFLENEKDQVKSVKIVKQWVITTMEKLQLNFWETVNLWLEDNDYIVNEEQEELDKQAKGKVKLVAKTEKPVKKTPKERVQKENPTKELIIQTIYNALQQIDNISNVNVENKAKLITFELNNEQFKVDLVQKRKPKA
jgi:hypothetical protein